MIFIWALQYWHTTLDKKKNHHRDSRREERCSTCDIMLDHARSAQGQVRSATIIVSTTFSLRWWRLIEHDITRTCGRAFISPQISRMVLFLSRVVNGSPTFNLSNHLKHPALYINIGMFQFQMRQRYVFSHLLLQLGLSKRIDNRTKFEASTLCKITQSLSEWNHQSPYI